MSDPIERSDALDARIADATGVTKNVENLMMASKRSLFLIRILGVSVVADIILSIALGLVAIRANEAVHLADTVQDRQVATCLAANDARAGQRTLWHYILEANGAQHPDAATQKRMDQFRVFVDRTFADRKC